MKRNFICLLIFLGHLATFRSQTLSKESIQIETAYGNMKIRLFEETPLHKANFLKLVQERVFDSLLFHRVINQFMIQGGDPLSKTAQPGDSLGHGDLGYTIPAEFNKNLIHKKGRLCAARESDDINPLMASSASQFYLVMGKLRTIEDLKKYEDRINKSRYVRCTRAFLNTNQGKELKSKSNYYKEYSMTDSAAMVNAVIESLVLNEYLKVPKYTFNAYQIETYTTIGGTPHLDGTYTVFGEVVEGIEIIDKIAGVKTDARDRPIIDVRMKVYLLNE